MRRRLLSLLLVFVLVLGMLPVAAFAAEVPFTVTVNGTEVTDITETTLTWESMYGGDPSEVTCYTVTVPEGSAEATLNFTEEMQWSYYDSNGTYLGDGDTSWTANTSHTVAIADQYGPDPTGGYDTSTPDGVLDGISVQIPNAYSTEYFIQFVYGSGESGDPEVSDPSDPFLNIKIGNAEVAEENIAYKGIFELGDYAADEQQGVEDTYDYVHQVPYYHVTVPCGTASVDVTYSGDTNIMNSGSNAYGYKTDLEVDAVSSATVRGTTFKNAYTKNEDGTQTVKTPVTGYTFDADGNGHAITLEEDGGSYAAVCLFSFEYDGKNHVYDSGKVTTQPGCESEGVKTFTCSCGDSYTEAIAAVGHNYQDGTCENCGEADPDYVAPGGAVIPDGAPFTALTTDQGDAEEIVFVESVTYTGYESYENVPYYHVIIPAGASSVYVTHPTTEDPFADVSYGSAYGYYAETSGWTGGGISYAFADTEDGYTITLPLSKSATDWNTGETTEMSFVADEEGYVGYALGVERNDYSPICFFTFEYAPAEEGEHVHSYDDGVVTTEPTCTAAGVKTFTCSGCTESTEGHSYTEPVAATGHSYDDGVETTPATCVADGVKTFTCSKCDAATTGHTKTETIGKLGHQYDEGVVTQEPTCTVAGRKTYTCTRETCTEETSNHIKIDTILATGHDYQNGACVNCGDVCPVQDANGVYQIGTAEELLWFAKAVNGGQNKISGALTADITVDATWPGIGNSNYKFAGIFDGQGYTVTFDNTTVGLFGYTLGSDKAYVQIKNVNTDGTVNGEAALIARARYTNVENCINRADVTGSSYAAGIVALAASSHGATEGGYVTITNCGNEGNITGGTRGVGGIAAFAKGCMTVTGCYNTGTIYGTAASNSVSGNGGIVGFMQGYPNASYVRQCYNRGKVSGSALTGGLVGTLYNSAEIIDSYNAGEATYAIIGSAYQKSKGAIKNSYYLASASVMGIPADHSGSYEFTAKTQAEMNEESFLTELGSSYKLSCPTPVLSWQETVEHTGMGDENGCDVCGYGSNIKQTFEVSLVQGTGYTISGEPTAFEGEDYTFTVTIADGYRRRDTFAVKVNGEAVTESTETIGSFTYENVQGPLSITVEGVEKIPDFFTVSLPDGTGKGYRVASVNGSSTVPYGGDYQFTVTMHENFRKGNRFQVLVNDNEAITPDENGVYTLTNVLENKTITVEGVAAKPYSDTAKIMMTITKGENTLYETPETGSDQMLLLTEMEIPYFDISLYGLERYYYNPDCYRIVDGVRQPQVAGNAEIAYGKITALHAFIYATEVHYLGLDENLAGTGVTYQDGRFAKSISWSGGVGSIFMKLWDQGTNLNYYVNYEYPLGVPGWGSTSDQILLHDGDVISAHMITSGETDQDGNGVVGSGASGSAFGAFVVNDSDTTFNYGTDTMHYYEASQGEKVNLSLYTSVPTSTYDTVYSRLANEQLYWIHDDDLVKRVDLWHRDQNMVTDENGNYVLDTSGFEPGIYYIGAMGGQQKGDGKPDAGGFVATGYERGPAVLVLTITEGEGGVEAPELATGDVNGDGYITADDAAAAFTASISSEGLTDAQKAAADVNDDGYITADDAAKIYEMSKGGVE